MQKLGWYFKRLRAMSPSEILWRVRMALHDRTERFALDRRTREAERSAAEAVPNLPAESRLCPAIGIPSNPAALRARADKLATGKLRLFGGEWYDLGLPPKWNNDPKHHKASPADYAPQIDYRDFREVGDCKWVWEPNRHHQMVVLARAWRATQDDRYARAVQQLWRSWLSQCPYARGMNWRSPLELAIRLINWTWCVDLLRSYLPDDFLCDVVAAVDLHLYDVGIRFSRGSSANNHLIGEAAGAYVAAAYFDGLRSRRGVRRHAKAILEQEIQRQVLPDGANAELATGYHFFTLQFFVLAGLVARRFEDDFSPAYWKRVHAMFGYLATLAEAGPVPQINDADDGYVLDLADDPLDLRPWFGVGAVLFDDGRLKRLAAGSDEAIGWLLGSAGLDRFAEMPMAPEAPLQSHGFRDAGLYLLQSGGVGADPPVSVSVDCGPLGYGSLAAHGHADALAITLRAFGRPVLVDAGTYDYFTYQPWRNHFRSTRAHNTIEVDGRDQSELQGLFLWGRRATTEVREWKPGAAGGSVTASHDGYRRLDDPVTHTRQVSLEGAEVRIIDQLAGSGKHTFAHRLLVAPDVPVEQIEENAIQLDLGSGIATINYEGAVSLELVRGGDADTGGWFSDAYHRKQVATCIVASGTFERSVRLETTITLRAKAGVTTGGRRSASVAV